jgi:hypothetical protein
MPIGGTTGTDGPDWWKTRLVLIEKEKNKGMIGKSNLRTWNLKQCRFLAGNEIFKEENFSAAAKQYQRAYKLACAVSIDEDNPERDKLNTLVLTCLNNLSTALYRLDDFR